MSHSPPPKSAKQLCKVEKVTKSTVRSVRIAHATLFPTNASVNRKSFFKRIQQGDDETVAFLARSSTNGAVMGVCSTQRSQKTEGPATVYILTLGVFSKYRRLGVGSKLVRQLVDTFRGTAQTLQLHVEKTNEIALSFYAARGFVVR
mgnify:CR=1 FL=1